MKKYLYESILVGILVLGFLIRSVSISEVPPSLFWDEMDIGYQAYSILKTGKDYFGEQSFLVARSFADFRAPMLIYLTMPFVALFDLTPIALRLPTAILGTISIFLVYVLVRELYKGKQKLDSSLGLESKKIALVAAALTAFAPWNIQYSRITFEPILMLALFLGGVICFLKGIEKPKWFLLSAIMFSLSIFTYNTMKLFVPLFLFCLVVIYFKKTFINKLSLIALAIFGFAFLGGLYGTVFQNGGQRFSEISIFTDPQTATQINYLRHNSQDSYSDQIAPGESPRFLDKLIYNKPALFLDKITQNYLSAFSTEFLFVRGDPNPRHSTSVAGAFYRVEALTVLLGLAFLLANFKKLSRPNLLLIIWVLIAPLSAVVTREGGNHASRLFMLFPALTIISSLGLSHLVSVLPKLTKLPAFTAIFLVWVFGVAAFLNFYFGAYKLESAQSFQYGFDQAVTYALAHKNEYEYVIIDDRTDSSLMNYLFVSKYDPSLFQSKVNSLKSDIAGFPADQIDNVLIMKPGERNWENAFSINQFDKNYLLIVSASQMKEESVEKLPKKLTKNQKLIDVIYYKSGLPVFYIISSQKPEKI